MQLQFTIDGQTQLSRVLMDLSTTVKDWTVPFETSGAQLVETFSEDVFESEGEAIDEYWAPLSPKYAIEKEKKYPGVGILEATGRMRGAFVATPGAMSLVVENQTPYFRYHQSIEPRHSHLPRRAMMALTENMREQIVKNFQTYIIEQLG